MLWALDQAARVDIAARIGVTVKSLFVLQWAVIVSAITATAFGFWAWSAKFAHLPIGIIALVAFAVTMWTINGVIWYANQRRPSKARITFDYSYGLMLEGIQPALDVENDVNRLEFRLQVRNAATGPIRLRVEKFRVTIEDRFYEMPQPVPAILPRASPLTVFPGGGFNKAAYEAFQPRTQGRLEMSILYGHPEDQMSRRADKVLALHLFKRRDKDGQETVTLTWLIASESDVAVTPALD